MKYILLSTFFCLFPMAFAEDGQCTENKGVIDFSIGTYKFITVEYCQMVYKKVKACQDNNVLLYEQGKPRVECIDIVQGLIDSGTKNIVKVSDQ